MEELYLDHAATTTLRPQVWQKLQKLKPQLLGNPSSVHSAGRRARQVIDEARQKVASLIGADFDEIIFTSGATEANNLAINSALRLKKGVAIGTQADHSSLYVPVKEGAGAKAFWVPLSRKGVVDLQTIESLREPIGLAAFSYVNNELGTVQPIPEIAKLLKESGAALHVDIVQAVNFLNIHKDHLKADTMSLSAHKIGGLPGTGALFVRKGFRLHSSILGGEQEFDLRAGTENIFGIAAFGIAAEVLLKEKESLAGRTAALRSRLLKGLKKKLPRLRLHGAEELLAPHIINISLPHILATDLVIACDLEGIDISAGSACSSGDTEPSRAVHNLPGGDPSGAVRISLGWDSNEKIIDEFINRFAHVVKKL